MAAGLFEEMYELVPSTSPALKQMILNHVVDAGQCYGHQIVEAIDRKQLSGNRELQTNTILEGLREAVAREWIGCDNADQEDLFQWSVYATQRTFDNK